MREKRDGREQLVFETSSQVYSDLKAMVATGLYGESIEAVAEMLLCAAVRRELPLLDQFGARRRR